MDAIELTTIFDLTGMSREEMMFDKEKLLSVFDKTVAAGTDPVRTQPGPILQPWFPALPEPDTDSIGPNHSHGDNPTDPRRT